MKQSKFKYGLKRIFAVATLETLALGGVVATCNWGYFFNDCVGYGCPMDCWESDRSSIASSCCDNPGVNCYQCNFQTIWCTDGSAPCSNGLAMSRYYYLGGEVECVASSLTCEHV
ncbi:MAG: hypothetical protein AKCLJLPJ_01628 [Fimbriimonadales bacterium]|nr:MAG: hypothetical protein EDM73_12155 [Armatimonadota bacterium]MBC6970095.1 hypothetical protein [Armatimonadota bacterium]MBV6503547.1 hypothetical protein [Fimbriimonadales bacterium]MCE7900733.1 hypothetical protein [Armatimonadetes bacterium ATM1]RIJ96206.1 MAG: hypothetical protein DCC45_08115 [Armatimonadota bacterium]